MRTLFHTVNFFTFISSMAFAHLVDAQTYCNPDYTVACYNWKITGVAIPQVNFTDNAFTGNCTSVRDKTSTVINMSPNSSYDINVKTTGWVACGMAIDFNQNGNFDDADEVLFLPDYIGDMAPTYTGNFTTPASVNPGNYRMRIWNRLANSGNGDSACGSYAYGNWVDYTVNFAALATSETSVPKAKIYPNPVSDILNIEDTQTIQSIEIYDFSGKLLIQNSSVNKKNASVKLSTLAPGVYTAKVTNTKGTQIIKVIKK